MTTVVFFSLLGAGALNHWAPPNEWPPPPSPPPLVEKLTGLNLNGKSVGIMELSFKKTQLEIPGSSYTESVHFEGASKSALNLEFAEWLLWIGFHTQRDLLKWFKMWFYAVVWVFSLLVVEIPARIHTPALRRAETERTHRISNKAPCIHSDSASTVLIKHTWDVCR